MGLAILTGVLGYLTAIFITIFGGFAILKALKFDVNMSIKFIFIAVVLFGVLRGILRYIEQLSNHYIAFKLLAIIRSKVFAAFAYITVGIIIPIGVSKIGNGVGLEYRNEFGHMNSFILDSLRGLKEVIQYKLGNEKLKEINRRTTGLASKHKSLKEYDELFWSFMSKH